MIGGWEVFAAIKFTSNGAATMQRIASSTALANSMLQRQQGQITAAQLAMTRYEEKMKAGRAAMLAAGTAAAGIGFAAGAAGIGYAVGEAAKFERAMTSVQIATGATAKQFKALGDMAFHVSGITAQSATTIASEMAVAAKTAFKNPNDLIKLFPIMAKYADVRFMASGGKEDPSHTIQQMSTFAHLFQAYGVNAMQKMLDESAKLQFTAHVGLDQLVTQGRMFIPNAVKFGVDQQTLFDWIAIGAQNGFMQGRGGTAINNLLLNAMAVSPTAHLSKAKAAALNDLQLRNKDGSFRFIDEDGHLQARAMVKFLETQREAFERMNRRTGDSRWITDIGAVFGKEAQRFVSVIADATTQQQMVRNSQAFKKIPGVNAQFSKYNSDLFSEWNMFKTDVQNIGTALALPNLPDIEHGFHNINVQLTSMGDWLKKHPDAAQEISRGIAVVTAGMGAFALYGSARSVASILGATAAMDRLSASITKAGLAADAAAPGIAGAAAAEAGAGVKAVGAEGMLGKFGKALGALTILGTTYEAALSATQWVIDRDKAYDPKNTLSPVMKKSLQHVQGFGSQGFGDTDGDASGVIRSTPDRRTRTREIRHIAKMEVHFHGDVAEPNAVVNALDAYLSNPHPLATSSRFGLYFTNPKIANGSSVDLKLGFGN